MLKWPASQALLIIERDPVRAPDLRGTAGRAAGSALQRQTVLRFAIIKRFPAARPAFAGRSTAHVAAKKFDWSSDHVYTREFSI
jgi:hypothetical protein